MFCHFAHKGKIGPAIVTTLTGNNFLDGLKEKYGGEGSWVNSTDTKIRPRAMDIALTLSQFYEKGSEYYLGHHRN